MRCAALVAWVLPLLLLAPDGQLWAQPRMPAARPVEVAAGAFRIDSLRGHAEMLVDPEGKRSLGDVRSAQAQWSLASRRGAFDRGYLHGALWIRWSVRNGSPQARALRFSIGTAQTDRVDLHLIRGDGRIERQLAGDSVAAAQRSVPSWRPVVDVNLDPDEHVAIYARVETTSAMSVAIRGTDLSAAPDDARDQHRFSGLMLGLMLGLLVYHLAAFVSGRERLHLWYCVQTAAFVLFSVSIDGTAASWLPDAPGVVARLPTIAFGLIGLGVSQFLRHFASFHVHGGLRDRILVAFGWVSTLSIPLIAVTPARSGAAVSTSVNLAVVLLVLCIVATAARRQPAAVRVVVIAWSAVVGTGAYAAIGALGAGGEMQAGREWLAVAFLFERVTMALPLAGRIRELRRQAQQRSAEAALARERTVRESAQRLDVETQLQAREAELRQSQKMEVVGQLAGGLAHDFNNTLQVVLSTAELLRFGKLGDEERLGMLDSLTHTAEQSAAITRRLLSLSRADARAPTPVDVNELVGQLATLLRRIVGSQIDTRFEPADVPCVIRADATQVEQALTNLALNARDAMPDGGSLEVSVRRVAADSLPKGVQGAAGVDYAQIAIADTGSGIAPDVQQRIFEPFFTTKPTGSGTGLGLAMVRGMLEAHDGEVLVRSVVGEGTTFLLYLPLSPEVQAADQSPRDAVVGGTERLLVVEDHPKIRLYFQRVLREAGYDVHTARDGRDALAWLQQQPQGPPDLIVSDLVMPGVPGWQLLAEVRAQHPGQPFLFCSGYSEEFVHERVAMDVRTRLLAKPFANDALLREVRASLVAARGEQ